jgi:hypothetical protein
MHGHFPHDMDKKLVGNECHISGKNLEISKEKQQVQKWHLKTKFLTHTILKINVEGRK